MKDSRPDQKSTVFPEFRKWPCDYALCEHCDHEFGKHIECSNCFRDVISRKLQFSWWKEHPGLVFMGVNIGQALSHQLRGFWMYEWRKQRGDLPNELQA